MKVGELVRLKHDTGDENTQGVGLIVQHQGESKGWEDCYYKIMWRGPWYTWEDVYNLELVNEGR